MNVRDLIANKKSQEGTSTLAWTKRKPWLISYFLVLSLITLGIAACGQAESSSGSQSDGPIRAVITTGMIADVVANVGGEHVEVIQLMGPGVDPHLYKATESDVTKLSNAGIIFYNGLHLEARMTDIFEQMSRSRPAIAVGEAVPPEQRLKDPAYENQPDPHIWMDVKLWMKVTEKIRDELINLDPNHESAYRENTKAYLQELTELEAYVQEQVKRVPAGQRVLVTAHDAFHYFGVGYDFEVFAPQGISTASEAGVEDIRQTISVVVEREIPAIFVESSVPRDVVEAIVEGARDRDHEIRIGGELFSDAMGEAGTPEGTYVGMIRHNIDTIVSELTNGN